MVVCCVLSVVCCLLYVVGCLLVCCFVVCCVLLVVGCWLCLFFGCWLVVVCCLLCVVCCGLLVGCWLLCCCVKVDRRRDLDARQWPAASSRFAMPAGHGLPLAESLGSKMEEKSQKRFKK